MNNYTERIEQYLDNALSAEERLEFENELRTNEFLKKEFEVQKNIMAGLQRAGIKHEFSKAIRQHILLKGIATISGIVIVVAALATLVYFIMSKPGPVATEKMSIPGQLEHLGTDKFEIGTGQDTIIETKGGIVLAIPAGAFKTDAGTVQLQVQEALTPIDIMKAGLSTTSNGELLKTAGMFNIQGFENGKELELAKSIQASVPADSIDRSMMLFDGKIDKDGNINWVNPVKIQNDLKTYDITKLDFYPAPYLPTAKAIGLDVGNKRFTDSLYYSFSGYRRDNIVSMDTTKAMSIQFMEITKNVYSADQMDLIRVVYNDRIRIFRNIGLYQKFLDSVEKSNMPVIALINKKEKRGMDLPAYEIDPSRIKAIWDKKFNNTILATKEFEERLKFIHTTCMPELLELYVKNLGKPMYFIDSLCMVNTGEGVRAQFRIFYERRDGGVKVSNRLQEKLGKYFADKYEVYRKASEKTWEKYEKELMELAQQAQDKRNAYNSAETIRSSKLFDEEYCLNIVDAYRQIGEKKECPLSTPPPARNYYHVEVVNTGWKNLDQYVFEATGKRESLQYETEDGRKAVITYSGVSVMVENSRSYDRVLVYLLPKSLGSFQRMRAEGNVFREKLNSLLQYDLVVLAYKGSQAYTVMKQGVGPGELSVSLTSITESALKDILNRYAGSKGKDMQAEAAYQAFEQKESLRYLKLVAEEQKRQQIALSIFPCMPSDATQVAPANVDPAPSK